ncbi:MAG TPA: NAD(P)/FAD-dependent oxidoreductase [Anaerolineales bacterium]|nr:NAD(P)/FAD-dependent oxidoreductase [Anaerolineales bacterium]
MSKINTIIIGAGAAGLATGACLKQAGIPNIILEQSNQVGATWRKHYDRLHLHTDKRNSQLPFLPMPKDFPRYPARDQVVSYLENYAKQFKLDIFFDQQVTSVKRIDGQWHVQTESMLHSAPNLVVACGYSRQPLKPEWPGLDTFPGKIIHSLEYKNGAKFKGQKVLVVGFGNSGGEIAMDLHEHGAESNIAVRSAVNVIPKEIAGIPFLNFAIPQNFMPAWLADGINAPIVRMLIGDITKYGLKKLPYGPVAQARKDRQIPLIDIGTMKLIRKGHVKVHPGLESFSGNRIKFEGGQEAEFDAIVLATGYRPRVNDFLEDASSAFDEEGTPTSTGKESPIPGLYFCGFYVSPTGMLREIAIEAKKIGALIEKGFNSIENR